MRGVAVRCESTTACVPPLTCTTWPAARRDAAWSCGRPPSSQRKLRPSRRRASAADVAEHHPRGAVACASSLPAGGAASCRRHPVGPDSKLPPAQLATPGCTPVAAEAPTPLAVALSGSCPGLAPAPSVPASASAAASAGGPASASPSAAELVAAAPAGASPECGDITKMHYELPEQREARGLHSTATSLWGLESVELSRLLHCSFPFRSLPVTALSSSNSNPTTGCHRITPSRRHIKL